MRAKAAQSSEKNSKQEVKMYGATAECGVIIGICQCLLGVLMIENRKKVE